MSQITKFATALVASLSAIGATMLYAENPTLNGDDGTFVNVLDRSYGESYTDIMFYVPGAAIPLNRSYSHSSGWSFSTLPELEFVYDPTAPSVIEKIVRQSEDFEEKNGDWEFRFETIAVSGPGYRYDNAATQEWEVYDNNGRLTSFGIDTVTLANVSYTAQNQIDQITLPDNTIVADIDYDANGLVSRAENHSGAFVAYTYNGDNLVTFTDVRGNVTSYTYVGHTITKREMPGGIERNIGYDSVYGSLKSITDANGWGRFYEYSYDSAFHEYYTKVTHSSGKVIEKTYNGDRELVRVDVNGTTVQEFDYADEGKRIFMTDGFGNVIERRLTVNRTVRSTFLPDGSERKQVIDFIDDEGNYLTVREVDANGYETLYSYDGFDRLDRVTLAADTDFERVTVYTYDSHGNIKTEKLLADANTLESTVIYDYDDYDRLIKTTYPEGNTTEYHYDSYNRIVEELDGYGKITQTIYDDKTGDIKEQISPLGNSRKYFYDALGRTIRDENHFGDAIRTEHFVDRMEQFDPDDNKITVFFDNDGQVLRFVDANGKVTGREYDINGRIKKLIDGKGSITELFYAEEAASYEDGGFDVVEKVVYPTFEQRLESDSRYNAMKEIYSFDGKDVVVEVLDYDAEDRPITIKDPEGNIVQYAYDPFGQIIRRQAEVGGHTKITNYVYDDRGNKVEIEIDGGKKYLFSYDRNGNYATKTLPNGEVFNYTYNLNDQQETVLDPDGGKTVYQYDDDKRPTRQEFYKVASNPTPDIAYDYVYSEINRVDSMTDGDITITYTRDKLGRVIGESVDYGTGVVLSHSQTYYANGQLESFTGPDGITYTYTYDAAGLLESVSAPGMGSIAYGDYEWKKPRQISYPGGLLRTMSYTGLQEIAGVTMQDAASNVLFSETYTRNAINKVTQVTTPEGVIDYTYDEELQVTGVASTDPDVPSESFTYDLNENRIGDLAGSSFTYDANNALTFLNADSFTYDKQGNLLTRTVGSDLYEYTYNAAYRLTSVSKNGSLLASYKYGPAGRRMYKVVNGVTTYYHYSELGLVAEANGAGTVTRSYGYELDGYAEDQGGVPGMRPLFQREGSNYFFFVLDHNLRPRQLVRSDGTIGWQADAEAFGGTTVDTSVSTITCNIRPSVQYFDAETGLHYNTMRYYDPSLGRYLRPDPLGIEAGLNFYSFVNNCPTYFVDPLGLKCSGCKNLAYSITGAKEKKFPGGFAVKIKLKGEVKGKLCKKCCDDGSCGDKGSVSGKISGEVEGSYKSGNLSILGVSIGAGIKVAVSGGGAVSGSAKVDCGSDCAEFKGVIYGKLTVGIYAEFDVWGYGFEAFGGGSGTICAYIKLKVCGNGKVSYSFEKFDFGGEIYVSVKTRTKPVSREFKISIYKGGGC